MLRHGDRAGRHSPHRPQLRDVARRVDWVVLLVLVIGCDDGMGVEADDAASPSDVMSDGVDSVLADAHTSDLSLLDATVDGSADARVDATPEAGLEPDAAGEPSDAGSGLPLDAAAPDAFACNGDPALCDRRYDRVAFATTHNAMSSEERRWAVPNQGPAVPTQLADGVRGLMLDTHMEIDGTPMLCHAFCFLGQQPLVEGLGEIAGFMDARPGAVITLILESYVEPEVTVEAFRESGLAHRAYVHQAGDPWPTLRALIDRGTPLVVLTDDPAGPASAPWLMYVWDHAFETDFSNATPDDLGCDDNRGEPRADLFILNHFLTAPVASRGLAERVNDLETIEGHARRCIDRHGKMTQFVTVDFYDTGGVLEAVDRLNGL